MSDCLPVDRFEGATIILPVMNETASLEETVRIILRDVKDRVNEILIVVCERTTAEAMATVDRLSEDLGSLVRVHTQTLPYLGGAIREAFDLARGSHIVMMASDLETDPRYGQDSDFQCGDSPFGDRGCLSLARKLRVSGLLENQADLQLGLPEILRSIVWRAAFRYDFCIPHFPGKASSEHSLGRTSPRVLI